MSNDKPDKSKIIGGLWLKDSKTGGKYFSGSVDNRTAVFVEIEVKDENGTHTEPYQMKYFRITRNQKKQAGDNKPDYVFWADLMETERVEASNPGRQPGSDDDIPF